MDLASFVLVYFVATALFIALLLFGESPVFVNTPIAKLHYLVTTGWVDGIEFAVGKVRRGRCVLAVAFFSVWSACSSRQLAGCVISSPLPSCDPSPPRRATSRRLASAARGSSTERLPAAASARIRLCR
jgi:hypothetical protein